MNFIGGVKNGFADVQAKDAESPQVLKGSVVWDIMFVVVGASPLQRLN